MFARRVSMHLKPNCATDLTEKLEKEIIPMLRKQSGFQDEVSFVTTEGKDAFAISLWDKKESADAYSRTTYPDVVRILSNVVEGSPQVETYRVSTSTFHKITP